MAGRFSKALKRILPSGFSGSKAPSVGGTTMLDVSQTAIMYSWMGATGFPSLNNNADRKSGYERMHEACRAFPPLHTALKIRSTLPFLRDRKGEVPIMIESKSERVKDIIYALNDRLKIPLVLPQSLYKRMKYGDDFRERIIDLKRKMVVYYRFHEPHLIRVLQNKQNITTAYYYCGDKNSGHLMQKLDPKFIFEPWQMCHFKNTFDQPYGESELYYSEHRIREYTWMVFSSMLGRIFRSVDARERFIDVSDCETEDDKMKRLAKIEESEDFITKILDSNSNMRTFNAIPIIPQNLYTPITAQSSERVGTKVIQGQRGMSEVKDLEHTREEALSPLGVPLRLLNLGKETISRAELTEQDKNLVRLAICDQEWAVSEVLMPLYRIELALHGIDWTRAKYKFSVRLVDLDTGEAKQAAQIGKMQAQVYQILMDTGMWDSDFLKSYVYGLSEDEVKRSGAILTMAKNLGEEENKTEDTDEDEGKNKNRKS